MTGLALTETAIKAAKPKDKPYMLRDDRGLWLLIAPGGGSATPDPKNASS